MTECRSECIWCDGFIPAEDHRHRRRWILERSSSSSDLLCLCTACANAFDSMPHGVRNVIRLERAGVR